MTAFAGGDRLETIAKLATVSGRVGSSGELDDRFTTLMRTCGDSFDWRSGFEPSTGILDVLVNRLNGPGALIPLDFSFLAE